MSISVLDMSMSLDGYIADPDDFLGPGRAVELEIADDGRGPNGGRSARGGGHGLIGMRERIALYGGSLDLGRHPGGGFLVRARLPIEGA